MNKKSCLRLVLPFKMAALCTCDEFVLLTNGKTAAVIHFSSPEDIQVLDIPVRERVPTDKASSHKASKKPRGDASQKEPKQEQEVDLQQNVTEQGQKDSEGRHALHSRGTDNSVLACAISPGGRLIALCDDRKFLHVYELEAGRCRLLFSSPVARRCTSLTFTRDSLHVVVGDRSGEVYLFDVHEQVKGQRSESSRDGSESGVPAAHWADEDGDESGGGSLLLGHMSMLLEVLLVDNDRMIVTCDRDEKIRISHFPDSYNIQSFCLGHTKFVSTLAYDPARQILMSGSGDATLRLWSLDGNELYQKDVIPDIPPGDVNIEVVTNSENRNQAWTHTQENNNVSQSESIESHEQNVQTAVQQISYCSTCQILFVAIYKSPHILVYKLLNSGTRGRVKLNLLTVLSGSGSVASMSINQCLLWVVRQRLSELEVSVHRVHLKDDIVQLDPVSEVTSTEFKVVRTLSSQTELLQAPSGSSDLIPLLWKSTFQEGFKFQGNQKRQTEADANNRGGKRTRK